LVKYLFFLKKKFDDKINNSTIPKFIYKTYISKMKEIRYIVIFDINQHPFYICDLELNKIIDVQQCKKLYKITEFHFKFPFIIPMVEFYDCCNNFFNKYRYFNNEREKKDFLNLMKTILLLFMKN
jgi:hypothetical protein